MAMAAHRTIERNRRHRALLQKIDPFYGGSHPISWPTSDRAKLLKMMRTVQVKRLSIKHLYATIFPDDPDYHDSESDEPFDPLPRTRPRPPPSSSSQLTFRLS